MELAMQIISIEKTVRSNTVQDLIDFKSQSLATQVKRAEQLASMMPGIKKAFDFIVGDILDLSTEKEPLQYKLNFYDENWLHQPKANLLKQIHDDKRANLITSRIQKQTEKH